MSKVLWVEVKRIGDQVFAGGTANSTVVDKPFSIKEEGQIKEWPLANGSYIIESDTGDVYFLDADTPEWVKMFSFKVEDS